MTGFVRRHPFLILALAGALAAAVLFAASLGHHARGWDGSRPPPPAGWMTVGHIAHVRGLDPREIDRIAGLPPPDEAGGPQTLNQIAADRGVPLAEIVAAVEAALAELEPGRAP